MTVVHDLSGLSSGPPSLLRLRWYSFSSCLQVTKGLSAQSMIKGNICLDNVAVWACGVRQDRGHWSDSPAASCFVPQPVNLTSIYCVAI